MWTLVVRARWHHFVIWIGLVAAAGVLFLPWLPTALRQITTWPSSRVTVDGGQMLLDTLRLYVAGPTLPTAEATCGDCHLRFLHPHRAVESDRV